ncbi:MAG TPA: hypothetical protein ENI92_05545 [Bacteroidetes bacterium]|nr:hypothetical protein [Bacteroidota bacterium]
MVWNAEHIQAQVGAIRPAKPASSKPKPVSEGFREALHQAADAAPAPRVTVSAHAAQRLLQRGITLDQADLAKIDEALDRASEKGAKESLFVLRDLALVVSVPNRTVITALHGDSAKENVFTQIDSAVLL